MHNPTSIMKLWKCEYCNMGQFVKKIELIKHYHELHDANVPEELLKPTERANLEALLNAEDNHPQNLDDLKNAHDMDESEEEVESDKVSMIAKSEKSLHSLNSALSKNNSIISLLSKNYNTKKIACPKPKCSRLFSRDHDLRRHMIWHEEQAQKIANFLNSLQEETGETENTNDNTHNDDYDEMDDTDMSQMIDDELKRLQQSVSH
ncbi:hypothetical protein PSN45_003267 [Yamadazyma tenuis]|nr:hypothetical protein PSN45_003267 [Yamadazyma tenuis]